MKSCSRFLCSTIKHFPSVRIANFIRKRECICLYIKYFYSRETLVLLLCSGIFVRERALYRNEHDDAVLHHSRRHFIIINIIMTYFWRYCTPWSAYKIQMQCTFCHIPKYGARDRVGLEKERSKNIEQEFMDISEFPADLWSDIPFHQQNLEATYCFDYYDDIIYDIIWFTTLNKCNDIIL